MAGPQGREEDSAWATVRGVGELLALSWGTSEPLVLRAPVAELLGREKELTLGAGCGIIQLLNFND